MKTCRQMAWLSTLIMVLALSMMLAGCSGTQTGTTTPTQTATTEQKQPAAEAYTRPEVVSSPDEALKLLEEGNKRYVEGKYAQIDTGSARREKLATDGQKPFAVIVTCSDSRVPPEWIFDQGLGDIFVVRVAGNVIDPVALGSVEYGAEHLKAPLVVVMGHEKCGAVKATVDGGEAPGSIGSLTALIAPAVETARAAGATTENLAERATDINVENSVKAIEASPIVEELVHEGKLKVLGAKYELTSGKVAYFEEKAEASH